MSEGETFAKLSEPEHRMYKKERQQADYRGVEAEARLK